MQRLQNLTATTLRNIIGDLELDETLTSRETINSEMRTSLDIATDPSGNQGESCGTEKYHASDCNPGCDGETDEGRT